MKKLILCLILLAPAANASVWHNILVHHIISLGTDAFGNEIIIGPRSGKAPVELEGFDGKEVVGKEIVEVNLYEEKEEYYDILWPRPFYNFPSFHFSYSVPPFLHKEECEEKDVEISIKRIYISPPSVPSQQVPEVSSSFLALAAALFMSFFRIK